MFKLRNLLSQAKHRSRGRQPSACLWRQGLVPASDALQLEERIMLDGALANTVVDVFSNAAAGNESSNDNMNADTAAAFMLDSGVQRHEVVVVDTSIDGYENLLLDLVDSTNMSDWGTDTETGLRTITVESVSRLVTLYAVNGDDGLTGITNALANEQELDAIHILSHGSEGSIRVGGDILNENTLSEHAGSIDGWGGALNASGDLLLYGCFTGADQAGVSFVNSLAALTDADVAASNDISGHRSLGGDWELETTSGSIETTVVTAESVSEAFSGTLLSVPDTIISTPAESFINEPFSFTLGFDNTGTTTGYEPLFDVFLDPGIDVGSVSYLGNPATVGEIYTWSVANSAWENGGGVAVTEHPLNAAILLPPNGTVDGQQWIVMELPFGSFVVDQPVADLEFTATLNLATGAVVGIPLTIGSRASFEFGEDAFNNPSSDAPVSSALQTAEITPTIMEIEKLAYNAGPNAIGDEAEQATGPNNPATYEITVDIANGQTVDNLTITDLVPNNLHYLGNVTVSGSGIQSGEVISDAIIGVSNGNQLEVFFSAVTGTLSDDDVVITFQGYIPEFDANGNPVVDALSGNGNGPVSNDVQASGTYNSNAVIDSDSFDIRPDSFAIQKHVSILDSAQNPAARVNIIPGDFLLWSLELQVSDYFSLDEFIMRDTFGDGHVYVNGSERLTVFSNGVGTGPVAFSPADVSLGSIVPASGDTEVVFDVANAIDGGSGRVDGDLAIEGTLTGKSTIVVTFLTEVQENFQYPAVYGGDSSVDVGDILRNDVLATAEPVGSNNVATDSSAAEVSVATPVQNKAIYAIAGQTESWDPSDPEISPGQTVTYRITVELPTSDVENLSITDYMPLPIFQVPGGYSYSGLHTGIDDVPGVGQFGFGPLTNPADFPANFFDTTGSNLDGVAVSTNVAANAITWDFASFDQPGSSGGTVDLLFTTITSNVPFEDGLNLTNQGLVSYDNTNNPQAAATAIVQIEPLAPALNISKGIVASPGIHSPATIGPVSFSAAGSVGSVFSGLINSAGLDANPIDSNVTDVDAGDLIRFALVIENTGGFSATNINVNDYFPTGFEIPSGGANVQAALGDGTALVVNGSLFDMFGTPDPTGISFEVASSELTLAEGREDATLSAVGDNIIIVTYELLVSDTAVANTVLSNTAEILGFAAVDGQVDYTAGNTNSDWSDDANAQLPSATVSKTLLGSSIDDGTNAGNEAVNGEYLTYAVEITVPEGAMPDAQVIDQLDTGLAFDSLLGISTSSADVSSNLSGGFAGVVAPAQGDTGSLTFVLGDIANINQNNSVAETVTLTYRVYVAAGATDGGFLNNQVTLHWDQDADGDVFDDPDVQDSAATVLIITPVLEVLKTVQGTVPTDAGDSISYEIVIQHTGLSDTNAYDVTFSDVIPSDITGVTLDSVVHSAGGSTAGFTLSGNNLSGSNFDLNFGDTITLSVSGTLGNVVAGDSISNTAQVNWSSLDDSNGSDGLDSNEHADSDTDSADVSMALAALSKQVLSTGIDSGTNNDTQVVEGEYIVYALTAVIPEGVMPVAQIVDSLPSHLVYDSSFAPSIAFSSADVSASNAGVPPSVSGQNLTFDLGTITNVNRDNLTNETVTIEFRVFVDSSVTGEALTNTGTVRWDIDSNGSNTDIADGAISDSASVDVIEAELEVIKTITTVPSDVGDTVAYEITIQHAPASDTDAYDVDFSDLLPALLDAVSVSAEDGLGNALPGFSINFGGPRDEIVNPDFDLALGESIVVTITASVNSGLISGTDISNEAVIQWDSLGDDTQGQQTVEAHSSDSDIAAITAAPLSLTKTVVSTGIDAANNDNSTLVAGEYVIYSVVIEIPEGTTEVATLIDTLDVNLVYDNSYAPTIVSSAGISMSNAPVSPVLSGNDLVFDFGTLINANSNNAVADTITITYRAYADADVVVAETLVNTAVVRWDTGGNGANTDVGDQLAQDSVSQTVAVAVLDIVKDLTVTPGDTGDNMTYTLTIEHTGVSTTDAKEVSFSDILPAEIDASSVTAVDGIGNSIAGFGISNGATQDSISHSGFDLDLGDSVIVTINGVLNIEAVAEAIVLNEATISWQSLGADAQGNQAFESSASDSDDVSFIIDPASISKRIVSTGINTADNSDLEVVAGEFVTYELTVEVPEGTLPLALINDTLAANLVYDASFTPTLLSSSGVTLTGSPGSPGISGNVVSFDLGTVINNNTDNGVTETITIVYRAYADSDVVSGEALGNSANLVWDADDDANNTGPLDGSETDTSPSVTVIVPELVVEKNLTTVPVEVGDLIVYEITIRHSELSDFPTPVSDTDAFDASFNDLLPVQFDSPVIQSVVDGSGNAVAGFSISGQSLSGAGFDLARGEVITLTVSGSAGPGIVLGDRIDNTASVQWNTLNDSDNDGIDASEASDSTSDTVMFSLGDVQKDVIFSGIQDATNNLLDAVPGEFITYEVRLTIPQGSSNLAELVDTLDPGVVLNTAYPVTAVPSSGNVTTSLASGDFSAVTASYNAGSNTLGFALGDIVNTAAAGTIEYLTLTYQVYVENNLIDAAAGDTLSSPAQFFWDIDGNGSNLDAVDGQLSDTGPVVTVLKPELDIEKSLSATPGDAGDAVEYLVIMTHAPGSTAAALEASFEDILPAEIDASSVSAVDGSGNVVTGFVIDPGPIQDTIRNPNFDLSLGDSLTITVEGVMNGYAVASSSVLNTATVDWDSLNSNVQGNQIEQSEGSDSDSVSFDLIDPLFEKILVSTGIDSTGNSISQVVAGEYLTYALIVTVPEGVTALADIVDTIDPDLAYDTSFTPIVSSSSGVLIGGSAGTASVSGDQISFDLGSINNSNVDNGVPETVTITYRVYAQNTVIASNTLGSSADFSWDANDNGVRNELADGVITDGVVVTVADVVLQIDKAVSLMPGQVGGNIEYTMIIRHSGVGDAPDAISETNAFDVSLSDDIPAGITGVSLVSAVDVSGNAVSGFAVVGNSLTHAGFDLALGESVTVTIQGVASAALSEGEIISNTANISWTSLNDSVDDGIEPAEWLRVDNDVAVFSLVGMVKDVVATGIDDAFNSQLEAVTGEYVNYELQITVPNGVSELSQVMDTLQAGLIFNTAYPVSISASSAALSTSIGVGDFSDIAPVYGADGKTLHLDLGSVNNSAAAGDIQTIGILYQAYVAGDAVDTAAGNTLDNTAVFRWDLDTDGSNTGPNDGYTESSTSTVLIDPELLVINDISIVPSDAGDTIEYTITIRHSDISDTGSAESQTTAYDVTFQDNVPIELTDLVLVSATDGGGDALMGFNLLGNSVSHAGFDLVLGDTVTVVLSANTGSAITEGQSLSSTAEISWSSLDSAAVDGLDAVEHLESHSDTAIFSVADIRKSIIETGIVTPGNGLLQAVAGEFVTYELQLDIPQGSVPVADIIDVLPAGVVFDTSQAVQVVASSNHVSTSAGAGDFSDIVPIFNQANNTLSFNLGDISNTASADQVETLTVLYRAYVGNNDAVAPQGGQLDNTVEWRWDIDNDGSNTGAMDGFTSDQASLLVIQPVLELIKTLDTVPGETGDDVQYRFQLQHSANSTATAYDIEFSDAIPSGIENLQLLNATDAAGNTVAGFDLTGHSLSRSGFELANGEVLTVLLTGRVGQAIDAGDTINNTASLQWSSLDSGSQNDGADSINSNLERVDSTTAASHFSIADVQKTLIASGVMNASNSLVEAVIGETLTYEVVVTIPQGTMARAELVELLPEGLVFHQLLSVNSSSTDVSTTLGTADFNGIGVPVQGSEGELIFDLGTISNINTNNDQAETLTLVYETFVKDLDAIAAGHTFDNPTRLQWDINGDGSNNGMNDGATMDEAAIATVLEPQLSVFKTVDDDRPHLGQTISYSVLLDNPLADLGTDAHELTLTDTLPEWLTLLPDSLMLDGQGVGDAPGVSDQTAGNTVSIVIDTLSFGDASVLMYSAVVSSEVADYGRSVDNTVDISWSSLSDQLPADGPDNEERDAGGGYSAEANESIVLTAPDYSVTVTSPISMAAPTDQFIYHIEVANQGTRDGTGVVVVHTYAVDVVTILDADGGAVDLVAGTITWRIPEFAVGDSARYDVSVEVLPTATLNSVDQMFPATATVTDDALNGNDVQPVNNRDTHEDRLLSGVTLQTIDPGSPDGNSPLFDLYSDNEHTSLEEIPRLLVLPQDTPRYVSAASMNDGFPDTEKHWDDNIVDGGDLLDNPHNQVLYCSFGPIPDYPWLEKHPSEFGTEELLEIFAPETKDVELPVKESAASDELKGFEAQLAASAATLYGSEAIDLEAVFKDDAK